MRKFLQHTALFSLAVIILLAVGELIVRRADTPYTYKAQWIRHHGHSVATLVLGSSHSYYGVRPALLGDSVFSLANPSQSAEYDLMLLRRFGPMMPNLKRIILPVGYSTFRDPKLEVIEPGLIMNYKVGMGITDYSDFSVYNLVLSDFTAYAGRLRNMIVPQEQLNLCDSLGFGLGFTLSDRRSDWESDGPARVAYLTQPPSGRSDEVMHVFGEILDYCRARGIECVLISTPLWHTFRDSRDAGQHAEMRQLTDSLVRTYGVRHIDMSRSALFADRHFHDVDHMSDIGSILYTRQLRDSLASPLAPAER